MEVVLQFWDGRQRIFKDVLLYATTVRLPFRGTVFIVSGKSDSTGRPIFIEDGPPIDTTEFEN